MQVTINQIIAGYCRNSNCQLAWIGGVVKPPEVIFADDFMMPVVTFYATNKSMELLGHDMQCHNVQDKASLLPVKSVIPGMNGNTTDDMIRALFFLHAAERVFHLSAGGVIDCYAIYEYFNSTLAERASMIDALSSSKNSEQGAASILGSST